MMTPRPTAAWFMLQAFSVSPVPAGKRAQPPRSLIFLSFSRLLPSEMPRFV